MGTQNKGEDHIGQQREKQRRENLFPPAVGAFLMVAMIAAAMSSLDSVLLVTASTCERDIVNLWRPSLSEAASLRTTRFYVGLFAFITALISLDPPGGIVTLTAFSGSLYAACFFPGHCSGTPLVPRQWDGGDHFFLSGIRHPFSVGLSPLCWRSARGFPCAASLELING